jgi:signal transduction histidine kinase
VLQVDPLGPAAGRLQAGEQLRAIDGMVLSARDLLEEPDALSTFTLYHAFLARQQQLYRLLQQETVTLQLSDGRSVQLTPAAHRPLHALPWLFWYQIVCGAIVFLAGMSVLAFRPREQATRYYALTGLGLLIAICSSAVYSTRELAIDGELLYALSLINQFGTFLFAAHFISILWYYPQRLHGFPFGPVMIASYTLCWLLTLLQAYETLDAAMRYPILAGLAINLSLAGIQWHLSRNRPVQRAILKWFLLAWLSGTTLYIGLYTAPLLLDIPPLITQSSGWAILFTVYLGIAMGITRYRLFNLDRWVVTGWYWFLGGMAVIAIDALLVSLLDLNSALALATSLAVAGWLYFPARQFLMSRLSWHHRYSVDYRELMPTLLTTMLNARHHELQQEWQNLLTQLFSPLHIAPRPTQAEQVKVDSEGVSLSIPGFRDTPGLELSYAERGSRLFNEDDRRLADAIHRIFCHIQAFREAFSLGVQEERQRLARDLHDDVGARLLSLVYAANEGTQADLARETLQELRAVIRDLEHKDYSLSATLTELRSETARRCRERGVKLQWQQPDPLHEHPLEARQHANLQRMVREAVSNALRHSDASRLQIIVQQEAEQLSLQISNDNVRFDDGTPHRPGRGMRNIRSRAEELGGHAEWLMGEAAPLGGYTVNITIRL